MTLTQTIDNVVAWLSANVCDKITLKLPDDATNDTGYDVQYVNPAAFPLYVPGKDRLPPSIPAPIPSICVQLMEGSDDLLKRKSQLKVRLCLACWNPGEHGDEVYQARKNPDALGGFSFYRVNDATAQKYARNMDGWRDSFNFMDIVRKEVYGAEFIEGLRLVKEGEIKYGLFTEEGNIWDYYPYWHSWITFTLECGIVAPTPQIYKEFL